MGVELAPVMAMLDETHTTLPTNRDQNVYTFGRIGEHNVVIAVMPEIGNNSAATVATQLLNDFSSIRFGLLVGIGGGVPGGDDDEDIRLGDIVVSKPTATFGGVIQYDMCKMTPEGGFERTGALGKPPAVLRANVEKLKAQHSMIGSMVPQYLSKMLQKYPMMKDQYVYQGVYQDRLFKAQYHHPGGKSCRDCSTEMLVERQKRTNESPRIHYGTIGSANKVVKDSTIRDRLRADSKIICVEMEAAGLMDTFPCLVIRGICDYADSHKNKQWQPYAAATAAAYMKELLSLIPGQDVKEISGAAEALSKTSEY
jgi:nucleoside phosphorylase